MTSGMTRIAGCRLAPMILAAALAAQFGCSDGGTTAPPEPQEPVITIEGVQDGGVYTDPVTIRVDVDRGSYTATLDDDPFFSGAQVSAFGAHRLDVTARNGDATAVRSIDFRLDPPEGGILIVRVLDLGDNDAGGGGDAILITDSTAAGMAHALVDAGPAGTDGSDAGFVAGRLVALGVDTLQAVVLTHAHSDHFQGLPDVLDEVYVQRFLYNGQERSYSAYTGLITRARGRADTVIVPEAQVPIQLGGSTLTVLPPLDTYLPVFSGDPRYESSGINEGSLGALLERATFDMFFTGDGEVEANERWQTTFADLTADVDVLKVGHHGANDALFDNGFSGASSWLDHTSPEIAVISGNGTSHPREHALDLLLGEPATRTYCTNVHGDIELRVTADGRVTATVEKNADSDCVPGSEATT